MPPPRFDDLRRFCEIDGWDGIHRFLADGTILRTRVSHGAGEIGDPGLWTRIWRDQLGLESEEVFWQTLRTGEAVERGENPAAPPAGPSIPGWVVEGLLRAGRTEADIRELSADEATRLLHEIWSGTDR